MSHTASRGNHSAARWSLVALNMTVSVRRGERAWKATFYHLDQFLSMVLAGIAFERGEFDPKIRLTEGFSARSIANRVFSAIGIKERDPEVLRPRIEKFRELVKRAEIEDIVVLRCEADFQELVKFLEELERQGEGDRAVQHFRLHFDDDD